MLSDQLCRQALHVTLDSWVGCIGWILIKLLASLQSYSQIRYTRKLTLDWIRFRKISSHTEKQDQPMSFQNRLAILDLLGIMNNCFTILCTDNLFDRLVREFHILLNTDVIRDSEEQYWQSTNQSA
jgi:hypothetical protein